MAYSIFPFKITPGQPLPQAALWFFEMEADPFVIQLKKYMEWAHKMLTACLTVGGQVWEVRLRYNASVWFEETLQEKFNEIHSTVCAPNSCKSRHVLGKLAPRLFFTNSQVYNRFTGTAKVLSSWKFVDVQFGIVGAGGCGTTSLRKNFEQHPQISFSNRNEDELYAPGYNHAYQGGFRMLPTKAQVNMVNCGKGRCPRDDMKVKGNRKHGVKNYNLFNFDFGLTALSMVENVKIILLVCDPLDRLEKVLYYNHCQFRGSCENRSVIDSIVSGKDIKELVESHREFWRASERIMMLLSLFNQKDVLVVHQEVLRKYPAWLYQGLFRHVGLEPPIDLGRYHRYNSYGGKRSGLCERKHLVKEFQKALEPEYQELEEILERMRHPKVQELSLRQTRCHRPNELRSTRRCVNQRCES